MPCCGGSIGLVFSSPSDSKKRYAPSSLHFAFAWDITWQEEFWAGTAEDKTVKL